MGHYPDMTAALRERYEKDEIKYFHVFEDYIPDYKRTLLTRKFYSKYEGPDQSFEADPVLMENIQRAKYDTPSKKYPYPITENQCYGWYTEPFVEIDKTDFRFYHPKKSVDFIKHELRLKMDESNFPKVKFNGIPFKVQ